MKREFLSLCQRYDSERAKNIDISSWMISEKFDGIRCWWDGGITAGIPASDVPWANTIKDNRLARPPIATGLWTRYGHVIYAPEEWTGQLPRIPLDGELWISRGEGERQYMMRTVKARDRSVESWNSVNYVVFETMHLKNVIGDGVINAGPLYKKILCGAYEWCNKIPHESVMTECSTFRDSYNILSKMYNNSVQNNDTGERIHWYPAGQTELPNNDSDARQRVANVLSVIVSNGGEGVVVRNPNVPYTPERSYDMLKYKLFKDEEATIIGFMSGKGRLTGKLGALIVRTDDNHRLKLSGMSDAERQLDPDVEAWALEFRGVVMNRGMESKMFKMGQRVVFRYRERSKDGTPIEARYLYIRADE
jgi:ATP-dependent DNA ligase